MRIFSKSIINFSFNRKLVRNKKIKLLSSIFPAGPWQSVLDFFGRVSVSLFASLFDRLLDFSTFMPDCS